MAMFCKKFFFISWITSLTIITFPVLAQKSYVGLGYVHSKLDIANEITNPSMAALRVGTNLTKNIAIEGQYLTSVASDNINATDLELNQSFGAYLVLQSETKNGFKLDLALGYAQTSLTAISTETNYFNKDEFSGLSWGVNLYQSISYLDQAQLRLSYQSLYKDNHIEISGIELGFIYSF